MDLVKEQLSPDKAERFGAVLDAATMPKATEPVSPSAVSELETEEVLEEVIEGQQGGANTWVWWVLSAVGALIVVLGFRRGHKGT